MNKSKLKQIIKEEYVDIMLDKKLREAEEGDTPKHFGSGQNIDVYGYTTNHFDICGSAVALFTKINEKGLEGMAKKYAHLSAKYLDEFFGIEKDVVEEGSAAPEQMEEAADKLALFAYELGCVGAYAKEDYTRDMAFSKMHLMVIADRYDGKMTEAELEKEKFTEPEQMRNEGKINEISVKDGLDDVMKGRTSAIEGVKISKEMASAIMDWMANSAYGRKYHKQIMKGRIGSLIGPANAFGIERFLKPAGKKEWKAIYKKHGPKREVNEGRPKKVTKQMWKKMSEYQRMDALLTVVQDPDDAEEYLDLKWNQLPSGFERDMMTEKKDKFVPTYGKGDVVHDCPKHVKEIKSGREGKVISHSLNESGAVNYIDVKYKDGKIERNRLTKLFEVLEESHHKHEVKEEPTMKIKRSIVERMMKLTKEQRARMVEKLVFYRDKNKKLRRFDTDDQ